MKREKCKIKLNITNENTMKIYYITEVNQQLPILNWKQTNEYPINIFSFESPFDLMICNISSQAIDETKIQHVNYMKEFLQNPNEQKRYTIQTQQNESVEMLPEILFAHLINQLKKELQRKFIIKKFIIDIPSESYTVIKKLKEALFSIGIEKVSIKPSLNKSIQLTNAIQLKCNNQNKQQFQFKPKLNMNCIKIASYYFTTVNDFINLQMTSKRLREVMNQLQFNPIQFNKKQSPLFYFPNMKEYHLYHPNDSLLPKSVNIHNVVWYPMNYEKRKSLIINNPYQSFTFKAIEYSHEDRDSEYQRFIEEHYKTNKRMIVPEKDNEEENAERHYREEHTFVLENNVVSIQPELFKCYYQVNKVVFPSKLTSLSPSCFFLCETVKEIVLPSTLLSLPDYCFAFCLNLAKITIPSTVTYIGKECFYHCRNLKTISIPSSVKHIGFRCFANCMRLKKVTIEKHQNIQTLQSLPEYCFSFCKQLKEIEGIDIITRFGKGCFYNTPRVQFIPEHILKSSERERLNCINKYKNKLERMTNMKFGNVLFDTDVDNWLIQYSTFDKDILNHSNLIFLIETEENEIFGYFTSKYSLTKINDWNEMGDESFFFSLKNKKRRSNSDEIIKYKQKEKSKGIHLYDSNDIKLLNIGGTILIYKYMYSTKSTFTLNKKYFDFNDKYPLTSEYSFIVKRLLVIEMI